MRAVFLPFFGIEVLMFCASLLIMLQRLLDFFSGRDADVMQRSNRIGRRIYFVSLLVNMAGLCLCVAAAIVLGDVINIDTTIAAAVNVTQVPQSTCTTSSETVCLEQVSDRLRLVNQLAATQRRCEAFVMIVLMLSFITSCYYINQVSLHSFTQHRLFSLHQLTRTLCFSAYKRPLQQRRPSASIPCSAPSKTTCAPSKTASVAPLSLQRFVFSSAPSTLSLWYTPNGTRQPHTAEPAASASRVRCAHH